MTIRAVSGGWIKNGRGSAGGASLSLNFLNGITDYRITYSGGTNGTRVNEAGLIVAAVAPRYDYNPVTLAARGLLVEEARTNSLRNNSMTGVAAGSPGTPPTNWSTTSTGGVVTRTIVGSGSEAGIAYVDIRYQFSGAGNATLAFEQNTQITAAIGNTWTDSTYLSLVSGGLTNLSLVFGINELNGAGGFLTGSSSAITPTSAALISQRVAHTRTLTNAATAYASPFIFFAASGAADITLRIGYPQMELGAFATSVIPTTTAAVTRTADSAVMTGADFSSWFNASQGTFVVTGDRITAGGSTGVLFGCSETSVFNNSIYASNSSGAGSVVEINYFSGGVLQASVGRNPASILNPFKLATSYAANNFAGTVDGQSPNTDASGTVPTPMQRLAIGDAPWGPGTALWNGHIATLEYYPQAKPGQLQAMTL